MKRDMDGPGADGQRWGDVTLQGIAHHKQFRGMYALMLTECQKLFLALVAGYLHIVEILEQP